MADDDPSTEFQVLFHTVHCTAFFARLAAMGITPSKGDSDSAKALALIAERFESGDLKLDELIPKP